MRLHLIELILFSTYAELRAERARSYLGLLWWIVEPAMNMGVYYLVFAVIFNMGGPDYVAFLLVGLTLWQWFKSCISHGGYSIWQQLPLIRQVKLPLHVFPSVQILADTVKFLCILAILLVVLWSTGYPPNAAYVALLPVLLVELVFVAACTYVVAAVVPLVPDLRRWFALNPIVELVDAGRGILMRGQWPDWLALGRVALISLALYAFGAWLIERLTPRYVKLPT